MRRLAIILTASVLAAVVGNRVFTDTSSATSARPRLPTSAQQRYLTLAQQGVAQASNVETRARNGEGLYLLSWDGETIEPQNARPGMLQTHAASTSLFAWLAVYPPPS